MINFEIVHNTSLEPCEVDGYNSDIGLKHALLATSLDGKKVFITTQKSFTDALNYYSKISQDLELKIVDEESFARLLNRYLELRTDQTIEMMQEEEGDQSEDELSLSELLRTGSDILTSEESAPVIKFVNALFYQAVKKRASDIHIEVHEKRAEVRFRIDGMLVKNADLDKRIVQPVISRIKVISNLDISEKRVPQDGRTQIKIAGETLDVRVSILPTFYGERVVMRLLMQSSQIPKIEELGFNTSILGDLKKLLRSSHGIILVTGPTGSGKTTSLHAFLKEVASPQKNLITVEDPVEYKSDQIAQIQVNEKVGLTFAAALRSILRQDPDVIMIGEIRDEETAAIAVRAALTGHLVFSTLHTNSAAATISRLVDMGIEPFLLSSSLLGILAQRLVRILCEECKEEDTLAEEFAKDYNLPKDAKIYKAKGCKKCGYTGYIGRKSIGEMLVMDSFVKDLLKQTTDEHSLATELKKRGLIPLSSQLKELLLEGKTSLDEALRIGLKDE